MKDCYGYVYGVAVTSDIVDAALRNINEEINRIVLSATEPAIYGLGMTGKQSWTLREIAKEIKDCTKFGLEQAIIWSRNLKKELM